MPPRILVVDDDEAIKSFVTMSLTDEGYVVSGASDGYEALQFLNKERPALVLLDMRMPNMDGRSLIEAYHQLPGPHAPIIVMTAGRNTKESTGDLNIQGFLAKPFDLDDLLQLIEQYVG
jgi:two-component system, OmpR family, response regulator MprA